MRTAVVTTAHGRHAHLRLQERSLARSVRAPPTSASSSRWTTRTWPPWSTAGPSSCPAPPPRDGLPLARARNLGAQTALDAGAELVVFLDVDCLVDPATLGAYERAAADAPTADDLLTGPTGYLPDPGPPATTWTRCPRPASTRPGRGPPQDGAPRGRAHAVLVPLLRGRAATWLRVGGFDEAYTGYGGEDTDYALRTHRARVGLTFVGDALTWHQWHPVSSPPVEHLDDLLRNGAVFAERWGWWPMQGWFAQLAALGLVEPLGPGWRRPAR